MKAAREIGDKASEEALASVEAEVEALKKAAESKEEEAIASVIADLI